MKFLSYHPQASTEFYVKKFANDLFDVYELRDKYDIDFFIESVLKIIPKSTHGLHKSVAAAGIYAISGNWTYIKRADGIPHLQQKQIVDMCEISSSTLNRILRDLRQSRYPNYRIPLKPKEGE